MVYDWVINFILNLTCLLGDFDVEEDDIPRTEFKPPPVIPKEDNRVGCNKKAYYVCNEGTSYTFSFLLLNIRIYCNILLL